VPGLINAYKMSAAMVLQLIPVIQKNIETKYHLSFDYTIMNDVMMVVKQHNCTVLLQELQLFCEMVIGIPKSAEELCLIRLKDIYGLDVRRQNPS
jgi:putative IMPACT (imprinted ancient) family translation regulator